MKKGLLLFLFLFLSYLTQAQVTPKKSDLLGTWKVLRIEMFEGSDTLFVADKASGVVFSKAFKEALAKDTSITEEVKQRSQAAMELEIGFLINMEVSFLKNDVYEVVLHANKVEGTYNWDKKSKKLTTFVRDHKEESTAVLVNKQLVLTDQNQVKRIIYERVDKK